MTHAAYMTPETAVNLQALIIVVVSVNLAFTLGRLLYEIVKWRRRVQAERLDDALGSEIHPDDCGRTPDKGERDDFGNYLGCRCGDADCCGCGKPA